MFCRGGVLRRSLRPSPGDVDGYQEYGYRFPGELWWTVLGMLKMALHAPFFSDGMIIFCR